jgi:NADH-quinone oxidoreductase subunit A
MTPTSIVAYLALFATAGFLFIFAALVLGRFLRARVPTPVKGETYECGEETVGSSFVQFDLRFYVVALLFIVFDVEVAFFFPWATVFGKATQLMDPHLAKVEVSSASSPGGGVAELTGPVRMKYHELGLRQPEVPDPRLSVEENARRIQGGASKLAQAAMLDVGVFFGVLLIGFAYVWKRGDLDWVRPASWRQARAGERR